MMTNRIWWTSDSHFGHSAIIKYCNRPFSSVEEMNDCLIQNWNAVVGPNDEVYHLGDFAFFGTQKIKKIREKLNGKIHLILGNHDLRNINPRTIGDCFEEIVYQKTIHIYDYTVIMNHYPFLCFPGTYNKNFIQLFGHVHSGPNYTGCDKERLQYLCKNQYDVGVDNNEYMPVSFEEIMSKIG